MSIPKIHGFHIIADLVNLCHGPQEHVQLWLAGFSAAVQLWLALPTVMVCGSGSTSSWI